MAEPKKTTKRIIDVQHPDKTPASDTSKPVIVTNRPILQDPMVVEEGAAQEDKVVAKASGGNTIQPLSAPELPESQDQDKPPKETKKSKVKLDSSKTIAELAAEAKAQDENKIEADSDKPLLEPKDEETEESAETKAETEKPEPKKETSEESETLTDKESKDELSKTEEDEIEKQAKKHAKVQELADSKKYYLPIETVEKRRSKRVVISGVLLSLLLIVAWVDITLDAGLIEDKGLPHTHFFDQSTVASPQAAPVPKAKLYKGAVSKLSFQYPVDWELSPSVGVSSQDSISLFPPKDIGRETPEIGISFIAPADNPAIASKLPVYIAYQKLAGKINGQLYLRDGIYQTASGRFQVASGLSSDNSLKAQSTPISYDGNFTLADGTAANFSILVFKNSTGTDGSKLGFATLDEAKKFIKSDDYQSARKVLLSLSTVKP